MKQFTSLDSQPSEHILTIIRQFAHYYRCNGEGMLKPYLSN